LIEPVESKKVRGLTSVVAFDGCEDLNFVQEEVGPMRRKETVDLGKELSVDCGVGPKKGGVKLRKEKQVSFCGPILEMVTKQGCGPNFLEW
jgi:hypothetical protein